MLLDVINAPIGTLNDYFSCRLKPIFFGKCLLLCIIVVLWKSNFEVFCGYAEFLDHFALGLASS